MNVGVQAMGDVMLSTSTETSSSNINVLSPVSKEYNLTPAEPSVIATSKVDSAC